MEGAVSYTHLKLGTLTDSDETYVNGVFVGETGYCFPPRIDVYKRQAGRSDSNPDGNIECGGMLPAS